jgi:hypothetical protein
MQPPEAALEFASGHCRRRRQRQVLACWVMLSTYGRRRRLDDSSSVTDDVNTVADSCTSKDRRVRVSLRCAAPPSSSYLYYDFPESAC